MFPSFVTLRLLNRSFDLGHRVVTNIYLKENGTQVVMYTLNGRKHVLNISDFFQQGKDQYHDSLEEMPNYFPLGHMMGEKEKTFLIDHTEANFPQGKEILKAIINGYNIDTKACKLSNLGIKELSQKEQLVQNVIDFVKRVEIDERIRNPVETVQPKTVLDV